MLKATIVALSALLTLSAALPTIAADQLDARDFAAEIQHNAANAGIAADALMQSFRQEAGKLRLQLEAVTNELRLTKDYWARYVGEQAQPSGDVSSGAAAPGAPAMWTADPNAPAVPRALLAPPSFTPVPAPPQEGRKPKWTPLAPDKMPH